MKLTSNLRRTTVLALCALALSPAAGFATKAPRTHDARGTIKSVDPADHTMVVLEGKHHTAHSFQWNDQTQFLERGKTVTTEALKAGEHVRITYGETGGTPTLQRVRIAPTNAKTAASATS